MLKRRGDLVGAAGAFQRAEARGHAEAASSLGNLLWDSGDMAGAKAAYRRSISAGSIDATLNLGLLLAQEGAGDEALPYLRSAVEHGIPDASFVVGKILEDRNDLKDAEAAYRHAAEAGNADAAFRLGGVLAKLGATDDPALTTAVRWARLYIAACRAVLAAANAGLEVANQAMGARNMAAKRPQHEISIRNFTTRAEGKEREFAPLYRAFADACASARDTAASFLAAQTTHDPELILMVNAEEDELTDVATVKAILQADYGFTPARFIEGVHQANQLMQNPFSDGNIYTPSGQARAQGGW